MAGPALLYVRRAGARGAGSWWAPVLGALLARGAGALTSLHAHPGASLLQGRAGVLARQQEDPEPAREGRRFAFVTMSYTPPGEEDYTSWGVLALAGAVRRLSRYPLVLLTNNTQFPDGTSYSAAFAGLGVQLLPVYPVEMPGGLEATLKLKRWAYAFWKLQIWRLTQFDRLIWLDADTMIHRSVDWLFQRTGMWAQPNDFDCKLEADGPCTGVLTLEPSEEDYAGIMALARNASSLPLGEQPLISDYFAQVRGRPIKLLSYAEASFGRCLRSTPPAFLDDTGTEVLGLWNMPAIVHKSGGMGRWDNPCFWPEIARQLYTVGEATINMCQYNPLGVYWRDVFCGVAHREIGVKSADVLAFCDDGCWYGGMERTPEVLALGAGVVCTPNATLAPADASPVPVRRSPAQPAA